MGFLVFLAFVFALIALSRTSDHRALRRRVERLEKELDALRGSAPRPAEATSLVTEPPPVMAAEPVAAEETHALPEAVETREPSPSPADRPPSADEIPPPPPGPRIAVDWERWVGVQGAAVLGGAALALAGLLFFKYSIEHGLISPTLRVVLGTVIGLCCVVSTLRPWAKGYPDAANALAGAGLVILYASFWAARNLYDLIDVGTAFTLMALVTSTGCVLSVRQSSLVIAILGLVGGFATPFLLSTGSDRPIGLFGYVLILDAAMLVIARRRGWPLLAALSLVGTVFYQGFWILTQMDSRRLPLALTMLGLFALVFAFAGHGATDSKRREWLMARAGGVLLPFAFAVYFAVNSRLEVHFYPIALLIALLSAAACWLDRRQPEPFLAVSAAAGDVGVALVWLLTRPMTTALAWESVACGLVLAAVFHCFVELMPERPGFDGPAPAAIISACGLLAVEILGVLVIADPWPWAAGWLALGALLARHATFPQRASLQPIAAGAVGAGASLAHLAHGGRGGFPDVSGFLAAMIGMALPFQLLALLRARGEARRFAEHAAALVAIVMLFSLLTVPGRLQISAPTLLGATMLLAMLVALPAARLPSGRWYAAGVAVAALVHTSWTETGGTFSDSVAIALAIQASAVLLFTAWPFLVAPALRSERFAWYAAALTAPAWFWSMKRLFVACFGDAAIAVLPLSLGAVSAAALAQARALWPASDPMRKSALAWFAAVALGFVSVAFPLQLERQWITIGWALEGFAVLLVWKRLDHPGLKYFGLALLAVVTVRLVANEALLGYSPRGPWRIVNWLLYTYAIPAGALLGASSLLHDRELSLARPWEKQAIYPTGQPLGAIGCGLAAIVVVFVWINLAIADWFTTGPALTLSFERMPARDLTTSIAWAIYALVLLAIGMVRQTSGLRWVSLAFLVLTIGKVFLYDLGQLKDLYRVMSLVGLAVSLILVSLGYQRFVFRKLASEEK
jgi:uncharacterized membrane protein